jgi:phage tail-like protein
MPITTPGLLEDEHLMGSWFHVELSNGITGFFKEASGLAIEIEVIESTQSSRDTQTIKRPGTTTYTDITLKRTLTPDQAFWKWAKSIRDGAKDFRTDGAIVLTDIAGEEVGRWTFKNVWPSKWAASDLDVGTDDLMIEEVTLACEELVRES